MFTNICSSTGSRWWIPWVFKCFDCSRRIRQHTNDEESMRTTPNDFKCWSTANVCILDYFDWNFYLLSHGGIDCTQEKSNDLFLNLWHQLISQTNCLIKYIWNLCTLFRLSYEPNARERMVCKHLLQPTINGLNIVMIADVNTFIPCAPPGKNVTKYQSNANIWKPELIRTVT